MERRPIVQGWEKEWTLGCVNPTRPLPPSDSLLPRGASSHNLGTTLLPSPVQSGMAGFPSASCHFRSFRSRRASLYCVAKGKGNLYGYGVRSVPNPRLFCLFTFSFIRPSSCSLAQSVSRSSVGDAKGYRAAISEMETWHFLSAHSLSCQIFHA